MMVYYGRTRAFIFKPDKKEILFCANHMIQNMRERLGSIKNARFKLEPWFAGEYTLKMTFDAN
jgi:hypothetical protein